MPRVLEVTKDAVDLADVDVTAGDADGLELAHDRVSVRLPVAGRQGCQHEWFHPAVPAPQWRPASMNGGTGRVAVGCERIR